MFIHCTLTNLKTIYTYINLGFKYCTITQLPLYESVVGYATFIPQQRIGKNFRSQDIDHSSHEASQQSTQLQVFVSACNLLIPLGEERRPSKT